MKFLFALMILLNCSYALSCNLDNHSYDVINCPPHYKASNVDFPMGEVETDCDAETYLLEAKSEYLEHVKNQKMTTKTILGKKIMGKKSDLEILTRMLNGRGRVPDAVKQAFNQCSDVLCILEKTLGSKEAAYRSLNIAHRSNYQVALTQVTDKDYLWSLGELRDLNYSVNIMPKHLLNSKSMGRFYVLPDGFNKSGSSENVSGWAQMGYNRDGEIVFRDHIRKRGDWATSVMIHEMAHQYDFDQLAKTQGKQYKAQQLDYLKVNGWKVTGHKYEDYNGYKIKREVWGYDENNSCFPRSYASVSPREDFAEAITYYIKDSKYLEETCPAVYKFMREKVFFGKEYPPSTLNNQIDDYIRDHDSELRKCINTPINAITILNDPLFATRKAGESSYLMSSGLKIEVVDHCAKDLYQKIKEQNDFDQLSCTMKTRPTDLLGNIEQKLVNKYQGLIKDEIRTLASPDKIDSYAQACLIEKDIRIDCIKDKFNQEVANLGYSFDSFDHVDINSKDITAFNLNKIGYSSTQSLLSCFESVYTFEFYLDHLSSIKTHCDKEAKSYLEKNGYRYDEKRLWEKRNEIITNEDLKIISYIAQEVRGKSRSDFKGVCRIATAKCVKDELDEQLVTKFPELKSYNRKQFIDLIYKML
jgi:hypothetical protein